MAGFLADKGLRILRNGYNVIPIKPGGKFPGLKGWRQIETTEADIHRWLRDGHCDDGIGITTDRTPFVDLDTPDPVVAIEMQDYVHFTLGLLAPVRIGNAPKRGLLFRCETKFRKISSNVYIDPEGRENRVEILGLGQQVVAFHIHPSTGKPYRWAPKDGPEFFRADELPLLTESHGHAIVAHFEEMVRDRAGWKLKTPAATRQAADDDELHAPQEPPDWERKKERIQSALAAIPADARGDHDTWLHVGMALHYESEGSEEGFDLWDDWSSEARNYNKKKTTRYTWDSFRRNDGEIRTAGTIIDTAKKNGWKVRKQYDQEGIIKLRDGGTYEMKKVEWLWPGWLARGKFHVVGGQAGVGKSTLFFALVAAITAGGKWPDGQPAPLGDVLIWSGEDDIADTILPRIVAAGGDRTRVHFVEHVIVDGPKRRFDPATDIPILIDLTRQLPELVMMGIDPVVSASAADSHKNAETRRGCSRSLI